MKILLVEDDQATAAVVAETLRSHHYLVNVATDGKTGLELAEAFSYDLVLLDVLIPEIDGISVCRHLRSHGNATPILLLTAKDTSSDRVLGLDAGADDYVVKPFHLPELLARIRAVVRRTTAHTSAVITWEKLHLDSRTGEIHYGSTLLKLTPKEYGILELLLFNPQQIFSRSAMIDRLWDMTESPGEDTITTHIKSLRQKVKAAGGPKDLIESVYGLGYRFKPVTQSPPSPADMPSPSLAPHPALHFDAALGSAQQEVDSAIVSLWNKFKPGFIVQVQGLAEVAIALQQGETAPPQLQQAKLDAHKLKGSLGIFGHPHGSTLAVDIEQLLQSPRPFTPQQINHLAERVFQLQRELDQPLTLTAPELVSAPVPHLVAMTQDTDLTELLTIAIPSSLRVEVVSDQRIVRHRLDQAAPAAILLDLTLFSTLDEGWSWLRDIAASTQSPLIVVMANPSLGDRVEIGRLGCLGCLQKPVERDRLLQTLHPILHPSPPSQGTILAVDDDPAILATVATLLPPWGLQITTLNDPRRFWDLLETCNPDLLLLDIEMPTFSGIELCRAVRNDGRWGDRPILFLTAHTDDAWIYQAFAAGADDYIRKPILAPELITRILGRLDRRRLQSGGPDR